MEPHLTTIGGSARRLLRADPVTKRVLFNDTEGGPVGADLGRVDRAEGAVWAFDPAESRLSNLFVSQGALAPAA